MWTPAWAAPPEWPEEVVAAAPFSAVTLWHYLEHDPAPVETLAWLRERTRPDGVAVVEWIADDVDRRPFVELADGRRVLLDTGSRFGLAIGEQDAHARGISTANPTRETVVSDVAGGRVTARRVRPTSIQVGPMTLSNIPTDVLSGVGTDAPLILGRDALRPFELTFDPMARLIQIAPRSR